MDTPLPSNDTLLAYSHAIPWQDIERQRRMFNQTFVELAKDSTQTRIPLDVFSRALGQDVRAYYDAQDAESANVVTAHKNGQQFVLGSAVSARYRSGHTLMESLIPYNLNPSVNHTNIHETEDSTTLLRVMGAEIELGVLLADGGQPSETDMQQFIEAYGRYAQRLGIYPKLDREACQYQVEAHIAPSIGYHKTRQALNGIMTALTKAGEDSGFLTAIMACYPTESDFKMTDHPKVHTAVDLMLEVNGFFPDYGRKLAEAQRRYHVDPATCHHVNMFRNQGCHIHIDVAGRSEGLSLLTFYTVLRSATALANAAVLKGSPFVNGTCDSELLCTREYLRSTTATGRYLELPLSPHFAPEGLERYASLLQLERANAVGRAMLYDESLGMAISVMHNPVGRVRPDLSTSKRVCTVESTGMPTNVSASRMAAVLTDFEFSHAVIENYFRKHGCDLTTMYEDKAMWALLGPLSPASIQAQSDQSDLLCTDATVTTANGEEMSLSEFYDRKRKFMHRALANLEEVAPREIDEVYTSLSRMLEPLSGQQAETVHQYICDPKLRSTGNWGRILKNAYVEAGGVVGGHCPEAVLTVVRQMNDALRERYLGAD
jgi:extradiol dioxygenase family protein